MILYRVSGKLVQLEEGISSSDRVVSLQENTARTAIQSRYRGNLFERAQISVARPPLAARGSFTDECAYHWMVAHLANMVCTDSKSE